MPELNQTIILKQIIIPNIDVEGSLESTADGVSLTNDEELPGTNQVYGTSVDGVKGWKADPVAEVSSEDINTFVTQAIEDLVESGAANMTSDAITDSIIADTDAVQRLAQALAIYLPSSVAPEITNDPVIIGTLTVPNTLTVTPGTVTGSGIVNTYQWKRDGVNISSATNITYTLVNPTDFGVDITVVQTATASNGQTDTAESAAVTIAGAADTTAPTISAASISDIQSDRFTVNTTTDELATHYYIVVPDGSTVPSKAQIIAGVDYGAVVISSAGNAVGVNTNQNSLQLVSGLTPETVYDVYRVAVDAANNQSDIDSDLNVTTTAVEDYIPTPAPPVFGTSTTIQSATVGSSLEVGELGGNRDILIPTNFTQRLRPNGLIGTAANPFRYKSASDSVRSWITPTLTTGQQIIAMMGGSNYNHFYHLGLVGNSDPSVTGTSGVTIGSLAGAGAFNELIDIRIRNMGFAGMHINSSTAGSIYNLTLKHICIDGHDEEGEGLYLGATGSSQESRFINTLIEHVIITNKGRDGLQLNNHFNFIARKGTVYSVGQGAALPIDQKNALQVQNSTGLVEDWIFYGSPRAWNIFSHGVTIRNCSFYITGANTSYIGKASTSYPGSDQLTGAALRFENCHFGSAVPITNYTTVAEDGVDVLFIDCTKDSNVTNIYFDNRADKATKTLSHTGTTTASSVAPTFLALDITDEDDHGHVTSSYHLSLGQGYHTPDPSDTVVAPTTQDSGIVFTNVTDTSMTVSWTESGDALGSLLLLKAGSAVNSLPVDDTNYSASPVYAGGTELGTGNYVLYKSTAGTVDVSGLTASTTYHARVCAFNGTGSNVKFKTTTATGNPASQATTAPAAFQPSDIAWDTYLDYTTAEADLAGLIWQNQGTDGDATVALNTPTWDSNKGAVRFTKVDNERFTIQAAASYLSPIYVLERFTTPTSFSGTNTLYGLSNTHRVHLTSGGVLWISAVNTGVTLTADTEYDMLIKFQGASSTYQINNGTETAISLSTNSMGTPNWRLGASFGNADHFNGWKKYVFLKRGLTSTDISNMWTWLGY